MGKSVTQIHRKLLHIHKEHGQMSAYISGKMMHIAFPLTNCHTLFEHCMTLMLYEQNNGILTIILHTCIYANELSSQFCCSVWFLGFYHRYIWAVSEDIKRAYNTVTDDQVLFGSFDRRHFRYNPMLNDILVSDSFIVFQVNQNKQDRAYFTAGILTLDIVSCFRDHE